MTTGAWITVDGDLHPHTSGAWPRHQPRSKTSVIVSAIASAIVKAMAWLRGVTRRGKPPRDNNLRVIRFAAIALSLIVTLGWALIGAAIQIW